MTMNSALKANVRRGAAMVAGFAMAATLTGLAVAGTASAAPAAAQTETASTTDGEYTIQAILFGTYKQYAKCQEVRRDLVSDPDLNIVAWCEQGTGPQGGVVWKLYYQYGL
ncbi:hypothetical protein ACFQS3_09530 [Glycomyces mayteni]|uniref:Secreted protein n=1 Tax=Glycomyces mayteni TaxID=543887 RepID=A0ABW2D933_9ACTN|nr:hypothetical protein GCM10025732_28750 [Glycomyces mayteni]